MKCPPAYCNTKMGGEISLFLNNRHSGKLFFVERATLLSLIFLKLKVEGRRNAGRTKNNASKYVADLK